MCAVPAPVRQPKICPAHQRKRDSRRHVQNMVKDRFRRQQCSQVARRDHQEDQAEPATHPGPETRVQQRLLDQMFVGNRTAALYQFSDLVLVSWGRIRDSARKPDTAVAADPA
jgi:hypothetical protein